MEKDLFYCFFKSPIGIIKLISSNNSIVNVSFVDVDNIDIKKTVGGFVLKFGVSTVLRQAVDQLSQWFRKERIVFNLPLKFHGTAFQKLVWKNLYSLRFGDLVSYKEFSSYIGMPKSYRAVSQAISHNPILIINPCHRVVSISTSLSGYSGGLQRKQQLLNHEGHLYANCFKNSKKQE